MKQRKNPQEGFYSISQIAKLLHVSTHTIRNLEREFSLEITKDSTGNRIYNLETVENYRLLIEKKNEAKFSNFEISKNIHLEEDNSKSMSDSNIDSAAIESNVASNEVIEVVTDHLLTNKYSYYNKRNTLDNNNYSNISNEIRNIVPGFSGIHITNFFSKFFGVVSFAVILISSLLAFGMVSFNTFLKNYDPNGMLYAFDRNNMSNVLQSTSEDFDYRFDVNVPSYINNSLNVSGSLAGSNATFQIITVGQVRIDQTGISAPNVVNLVSTRAGESVILVDNTNRNQPVITLAANPEFDTVTINNLNGVTALDDTTLQTIQDNIEIPTANADAETLGGLAATDFLRSNANTIYTGGTLEFGASSSVKFSNLSSNTFLRLNSQNVLTSFDIVAGDNIAISSTANSLIISASTGATNNIFSSAAVKDLFLGSTSFDEAYRVVATASELNKLHTLSGNLITTSNLTAELLTAIPNIDTNASDDLDNAVLISSLGGKTIYSTNTWYGTQDFANIKVDNLEVESNGYIKLVSGSIPVITNSALYNSGNRLYFEDLPLAQVANTSIVDNVNKLAYFVTDASGNLLIQGKNGLALDIFETGANGQIIGVFGNSTEYLTVNGDLSVSTTSSSAITFQLNNVNSTPGTFGSASYIPVITVNSKGQITSITTAASSSNNYTSNIMFSTPSFGNRTLLLERFGLSTLSANFSLSASDITAPLGFTPLKNTSDTLSGNLLVTGTFSANSIFQNGNLVCDRSGNCTDVYVDTTNPNNYVTAITFSNPAAGQKALVLSREGLTNLTAIFSISSSDVTTALGYTPLRDSDTVADKFINSIGVSTDLISQNVTYNLTISRSDLVQFSVPFSINPAVVTTALGYTPLKSTSDSMSGNLVVTGSISAGSIFIDGNLVCDASGNCSNVYVDTTNANNYVTGISFSNPANGQKTLTLTRFGLTNLTATFSLSNGDIVAGLGYTPLQASDTIADKFINSFGIDRTYVTQNMEFNFSLGRSDGTVILASTYLTPKEVTTALGYTPLRATDTLADRFINSYGLSTNISSQNIAYTFSIARNDGTTFPVNFALTPLTITTALGYTPLQASDTVPSYFVSSIAFSDAAANTKVFTLNRQGTNALSAIFSLSSSDITSGLGYTPLNLAGGTISGNLTITGSLSANRIFQNGNLVCDFSGNCDEGHSFGTGSAGYISLFTNTNSLGNSNIFQSFANGYIGIGTTNPGELLDVYGALKLSQDMGTEARNNALYQSGGVLYWNGQAVGVVGSTAPGGISGTKDYIPYFNTKDTLIASELFYESGTTERSLELVAQTVIPTYLGIGHKGNYSLKLGVAADSTSFYTRYDSEDDVILQNVSNTHTSDLIFALDNDLGKILFVFDKNADQTAPFAMTYSNISTRGSFGINTTSPSFNLDVVGSARITETLAVKFFSNPSTNSFEFLSGANFRGNLSAAVGTFTNLTLASALGINYGGTGLTQTPANGQILIGSNGGYALAPIIAGTNILISTTPGGITINAVLGGTNANNYVTTIVFSDPATSQKTLVLSREGLTPLSATFSISASDITGALGYTPLRATDTEAEKYINSFGLSSNLTSQNVAYTFSIARNDGLTFPVSFALTPAVITTALGYTPLQATDTTADKYIESVGSNFNYISQNVQLNLSIGRSDLTVINNQTVFTPAFVTSALGYTPLRATDTAADKFINSFGLERSLSSQNVSYFFSIARNDGTTFPVNFALTPLTITTALGYTPLQASDTVPSYFVSSITFSDAAANTKVFTLNRQGTNALSTIFSLSSSDIVTALGYTPLQATDTEAEKYINSFGLSTSISSQNIAYTFSIDRNDGIAFPVNFALTPLTITTALGYTPLQASDTVPGYFVSSITFSDAAANTKVFTLNRQGTNALSAIFSLSSSDITTALTYTPVNKAGDSISGNLVVAGTLAGNKLFQNGFMVCDASGNCSISISDVTSALGYTPLKNTSDTLSGSLIVTTTFGAASIFQNGNQVCDTSGNCSGVYTDTNNFVSDISFTDSAAGTKLLTLSRQGTNALSALFSLSSSDITTALTYTPVNKAGDTVSGNLIITQTLGTAYLTATNALVTDSLSAKHLFLADTTYTNKYLHIEPTLGDFNSKLILDLNVGSPINTTLGMYIQSAKFSSALGTTKNLTFNVLDSELNTIVDIKRSGTIPSIYQGSVDFYGASLLGADASFDNLGVKYNFSASTGYIVNNFSAGNTTLATLSVNGFLKGTTANFSGNLSTSTAFINGYFSAGSSSLAGLALTSGLYGTTGVFSGNVTMASAFISGDLTAGSATITGVLNGTSGVFSGNVTMASAFISGDLTAGSANITGALTGTTANFSGNASFASAFIANNFSVAGTGFFNTVATGVFSTPLATNMFTFLGGANFTGNISAANGTFVTLSAQSLNVADLFTVDSSGSVFNNNVSFNDTVEFNAIGDVAIANDLVFTNTSLSKIRSANDITFEVGESYNSSNLTVNLFNSGRFVVNGDAEINGTLNTTIASAIFSLPTSDSFVFLNNLSGASAQFNDVTFNSISIAGTSLQITAGNTLSQNLGTGYSYDWQINGTSEMTLNSSVLDLKNNSLYTGFFSGANSSLAGLALTGFLDGTTAEFSGNVTIGSARITGSLTLGGNLIGSSTSTLAMYSFSNPGEANRSPRVRVGATSFYISTVALSDLRLKENITAYENPFSIINLLNPVSFNMKNIQSINETSSQREIGLIAQEVESIMPYVVSEVVERDGVWYKGIDYGRLTPLLISGIKEQQVQISTMSAAIATIDFSQASSMYNSLLTTINALSMSTDNGDLVVGTDLIVNGKTIMNEATFTGDVQMGQMSFNTLENSLNVLGASCVRPDGTLDEALCQTQSLFLMKNKAGNLNIFDGKVVLKPNGDMQIEKINVTEIKADEYKVASSSQVSGTETLLANQTEIVITTNKVKANSKVFVTASNNLEGKTLYVDEKVDGVSFKVKINQSMTTDVKFDWFILNVE